MVGVRSHPRVPRRRGRRRRREDAAQLLTCFCRLDISALKAALPGPDEPPPSDPTSLPEWLEPRRLGDLLERVGLCSGSCRASLATALKLAAAAVEGSLYDLRLDADAPRMLAELADSVPVAAAASAACLCERGLLGTAVGAAWTAYTQSMAGAEPTRLARGLLGQMTVSERALRERVEQSLAQVGLSHVADQTASELPYGHQRLLEVAMSLALTPRLLILDEPTQGLANSEIDTLCEHVRAIADRITVLIIEHNMPVVLELADRVTVMDRGAILAEGTPAEIERDPQVQRAYLGS